MLLNGNDVYDVFIKSGKFRGLTSLGSRLSGIIANIIFFEKSAVGIWPYKNLRIWPYGCFRDFVKGHMASIWPYRISAYGHMLSLENK